MAMMEVEVGLVLLEGVVMVVLVVPMVDQVHYHLSMHICHMEAVEVEEELVDGVALLVQMDMH